MANPKIPAALGKSTVIFKNGNTNDIMKVIQMGKAVSKIMAQTFANGQIITLKQLRKVCAGFGKWFELV